ncbi:Af291909-2recq family helicase [Fusarium oxysporum f. sp. albedinis]|nr:Af291909-2recq family helicase [Fusarium oxysporum f. sp. albedinis]
MALSIRVSTGDSILAIVISHLAEKKCDIYSRISQYASLPIPFIAPPSDNGIACNACPYVIGTIQGIQKHHREEHGWVNDWKKGGDVAKRAKQERQVPWRTGVYCQRFFPGRAASRWFEVNLHPFYPAHFR